MPRFHNIVTKSTKSCQRLPIPPFHQETAVHHCMGGSQNFTLKQTTKPISLYLNYDIKRFSVQTAGASQQLRKAQIYHITCYVLLMTICNSSFPCVFRCQRLPPCKARDIFFLPTSSPGCGRPLRITL